MNPALLKLAGTLAGGPSRMVPGGIPNVIKFLQQIIKTKNVPKYKKEIANRLIRTLKTGEPLNVPMVGQGKVSQFALRNIRDNVSDVTNLGKGNTLRQELMINPWDEGVARGYYLGLKNTPMIDIDLPIGSLAHNPQQMLHGFRNKSDFMKHFERFLISDKGKSHKFRLYDTPGGVRLWDMSKRMEPQDYLSTGVSKHLGQDRFYTSNLLSTGNYSARLSPKPGRVDDFVARFDDVYGYGPTNLDNQFEVLAHHDDMINFILDKLARGDHSGLGGLFQFLKGLP